MGSICGHLERQHRRHVIRVWGLRGASVRLARILGRRFGGDCGHAGQRRESPWCRSREDDPKSVKHGQSGWFAGCDSGGHRRCLAQNGTAGGGRKLIAGPFDGARCGSGDGVCVVCLWRMERRRVRGGGSARALAQPASCAAAGYPGHHADLSAGELGLSRVAWFHGRKADACSGGRRPAVGTGGPGVLERSAPW